MGLKIGIQVQVDHFDGTVMVQAQRLSTIMNPNPRDVAGDTELGAEALSRIMAEVEEEVKGQLTDWKNAATGGPS